jgi:serine/threonine protein kinase
VGAVQGTAAYPVNPTVSFPSTPDAAGAETATAGGNGGSSANIRQGAAPPDGSPSPGTDDLPQIPGYEVLRVLGGGGMGTVFQARHLAMDKMVALKLINSGWAQDNDFRRRFALEVKALARLDHPNIVPIYDAASWQGLPYMTMKFVAGKTLWHHLDRIRRDPCAAARLMIKVARAVHYLHEKGIIHRDLKPLNILLAEDDVPLVADFGLVRLADNDSGVSISLIPLGTRQYMSPEQTLGGSENYTPACDIWALGVILYELLTGSRPFSHTDTGELYRRIRHDPVPPLALSDPRAVAGLEAVARKCLAKAITDRYATAEDVAADLERWLAGEEITPPPPEPIVLAPEPEPVTRPPDPAAPRRRYRWAVAAVLLLSTLGFSGVPQQPPPPEEPSKARTITERLAAGETVWLIREKGLPSASWPVPGTDGALSLGRGGCAALSSPVVGAAELSSVDLPWPIKLRAEYAIVATHSPGARVGVYIGRKESLSNPRCISFIQFGHSELLQQQGKDAITVTRLAGFELSIGEKHTGQDRMIFPVLDDTITVPAVDEDTLRWHTVEVVIRPELLTGTWNGRELKPVFGPLVANQPKTHCIQPRLESFSKEWAKSHPPAPFAAPYIGPGMGLFVFNASAVFRNVGISRVEK